MIIENSKDILNLLLGLSAALVAIVFSWLLYQMGKTIKKANQIVDNVQKITASINDGMKHFKEKAASSAAAVSIFVKATEAIVKHLSNRQKANKNKKQK